MPGTHIPRSAWIRSSASCPGSAISSRALFAIARSSCRRTRCGLPRVVQLRMIVNVAIDTLDRHRAARWATWSTSSGRPTTRNFALLERHALRRPPSTGDWLFVTGMLALVLPLRSCRWSWCTGSSTPWSSPACSVTHRVFLLSPANCGGTRARQVLSPNARFALAARCDRGEGATLGDVFAFVSGLYFRGKLTYARRFARAAGSATTDRRLRRARHHAERGAAQPRHAASRATRCARSPTATSTPTTRSYRAAARAQRAGAAREIGPDCDVVLLGSIASPKYVDVLLGDLRRAAAVSGRLRRPRRHEPRRAAAAQGARTASSWSTCRSPARCCTAHGRRSCRRSDWRRGCRIATSTG